MTFASDEVRLAFHQLPTATQVEYVDWEASLAKRGRLIHVISVSHAGNILDVSVRISENCQVPLPFRD